MGKKQQKDDEDQIEITEGTPTELGLELLKGLSCDRKKHNERSLLSLVKSKADLTMKYTDVSDAVTAEYASIVDYSALHYAAQRHELGVCEAILDAKGAIDQQNAMGMTALMTAVVFGQTEVSRLLVSRNASVHMQEQSGLVPLDLAVLENKQEIIRILIAEEQECERRMDAEDQERWLREERDEAVNETPQETEEGGDPAGDGTAAEDG